MGTSLVIVILLIIALIGGIIVYKVLKPYVIRHDTTECFTGGLGSGKTRMTTTEAKILIRKSYFFNYVIANAKTKFFNFWKKLINKSRKKHGKPLLPIKPLNKKPKLYSNYPIYYRKHILFGKRIFSQTLTERHILLLEPIREYSVVVIDELPQFINQFNWQVDLVQKNVNEFITFFRHYYGGYLIVNAQSIDDIVCQIRRKMNHATWCYDFHAWPLPVKPFAWFYTVRCCDMMLTDQVQTMSTTYLEENTKLHFGLFPIKRDYDPRCYRYRIKNAYLTEQLKTFRCLTTNKVLRLQEYISPLDDYTTDLEKSKMKEKADKLCETQRI